MGKHMNLLTPRAGEPVLNRRRLAVKVRTDLIASSNAAMEVGQDTSASILQRWEIQKISHPPGEVSGAPQV